MIAHLSRPRSGRRGAVAALTAIMMVVLLAMLAFAIDLSYWAVVHTEAQTCADAACLAGAGKLLDQTRMAPIVLGVPVQTGDDLTAARKEAALFAALNKVGGFDGDLQDADIDIGYLAAPFSHNKFNAGDELDTSGWPGRPYNAVRVRIHRDKDHNGGPVNLSFAKIVNTQRMDVTTTATAAFPMGRPNVSCGKPLPLALHIDLWKAMIAHPDGPAPDADGTVLIDFEVEPGSIDLPPVPIQLQDRFGIKHPRDPADPVSEGADGNQEVVLYPIPVPQKDVLGNKVLPAGNYGTIDIGGLNNPAAVIERQLKFGPSPEDYEDIYDHPAPFYEQVKSPQTEASFLESNLVMIGDRFLYLDKIHPLTLQGDTGVSGGPMEDGGLYARGEVRLAPLFDFMGPSGGNNAFFHIIGFALVTIVEADMSGNNKRIVVQPALDYEPCLDLATNPSPVSFFAGQLQLVR